LLRKSISAIVAVHLAACAATSFAEADNGGTGKVAADKTAVDNASAGQAATGSEKSSQPATDKIAAVKVKGNHRIESAAILLAVRVKAGETLNAERVDADVRSIFKLGYFRNVQAETEKSDGGLILYYVVQEKPIVREVKIEGAKEISADKVRDAITIKPNTIYTFKDLQNSIKKVKKLYADDGYYLAEVEGTTVAKSDTDLNVVFHIKEGEKVLIKKIAFDGNHAFTDKKLKKNMETGEKWFMSWLTGAGTYKEDQLRNDTLLISDLYMNNGYINVKVGEPKVELLPDKSGLKVTIGITEGDQYRIGAVDLKGDLLESHDKLMKLVKEKSGDIFSRANLRTDITALTDFYADKGYAFANAAPLTNVHPETHTMDITFDMEKGNIVHIDRINVAGNTKTRDKVVRRELKLDEGDLYNATAMKKSKQNLMNTGFFEEANLVTAKGGKPDLLDLNVDVKEKATGTFSVGAGYSSLDGIIGQGSVQQANFLGLGLKAQVSVSFGSKTKTYNLGLTDPYFLDSKWSLGGDVYRTERDYLDYTRRATGGDIKAGYPLSDNVSTFWIYKYEQKEIFNESPALLESIHNGSVVAPETSSTTSSVTASLSSNTTDYHLDPSTGWINTLSVEFAGLGGSNRFIRYITEHTFFYPVGWGTVASARGTLGYIQGYGGKEIPIDEKFYLGGIGSLRGYSPRTVCTTRSAPSISMSDGNGAAIQNLNQIYLGGQMEAIANLEYTFPLLKEAGLKGVVFFDAGNSRDNLHDTFSNILASYGGGIRWFSPIGPLRLEYGIPVNPRPGLDKSSGRLEFSIGSMF
jgi:outer membrane protein insertion porin family